MYCHRPRLDEVANTLRDGVQEQSRREPPAALAPREEPSGAGGGEDGECEELGSRRPGTTVRLGGGGRGRWGQGGGGRGGSRGRCQGAPPAKP